MFSFKMKHFVFFILLLLLKESTPFGGGIFDINFFRCNWKLIGHCPNDDILFRLHTPKRPNGKLVNVLIPGTFYDYQPKLNTAIIIHGFNDTQTNEQMRFLTDAYVSRNFNVITVDWADLTAYPCYLSAISNSRLVAQCSAQIYSYLTYKGSKVNQITCIGHSLGAHICGMMNNHLSARQHKIIGLDPASPLIEQQAPKSYRLTRDDAKVVQIIHTNAGTFGQMSITGTVDFCINGGVVQPFCRGDPIQKAMCSHFLSVCFIAKALFKKEKLLGLPCPNGCIKLSSNQLPAYTSPNHAHALLKYMHIGQDTPENQTGTYCVLVDFAKHCPYME